MKSVAILVGILPLLLALPAVGQETETPKQEGTHPHVRIERKIVKIDSLGNRTKTEDISDHDVMLFHGGDGDDAPSDINENFDIDVDINGDPSSPEFQEKMKAFEERMKAFGERMKQMTPSSSSFFQGGSDSTMKVLQSGLSDAEKRVAELRARLKNLPKSNPQYDALKKDLASASKDLDEARAAVGEAGRASVMFIRSNGANAAVYNVNGMQFNVDSIVRSVSGNNGAALSFGSASANGRGHRVMVQVTSDSLHGSNDVRIMTNGDGKEGHGMMFRFDCNDSLGSGHGARILIRSITSTNSEFPASADFTQGPVTLKSNVFYIDGDSVHLVDGKSAQMVLRIDQGASDDGKTKVMVMSIERGATSNNSEARPRSEGALNLADAPLVPRGSIGYQLGENVPNPFAEKTAISFTLPKSSHVSLSVFDGTGNLVKTLKDEEMSAGTHSVDFNATGLPSGIYLYRLVADGFSEAKTMTIAK